MQAVYTYLHQTFSISKEVGQTSFLKAREGVHKRLHHTAASHNRLLYFQNTLENLGLSVFPHSLAMYDAYWNTFLEAMKLENGALEFLLQLRKNGKKICLLTDLTAHIQHRKVQRLELADYLDAMVTSEEAGREKPDASMFELALSKLNVRPHEACMVGDNLEKDCWGAHRAHLCSVWLQREASGLAIPPDTLVVTNLNELLPYA
jgi:putative hydrolase of the HAD superfamily